MHLDSQDLNWRILVKSFAADTTILQDDVIFERRIRHLAQNWTKNS